MAKPESSFPTIRDLHTALAELVEQGLGDLPVQILIVPDSTMQALARSLGGTPDDRPALMMDLGGHNRRQPVSVMSTDRFSGKGMRTTVSQ